MSERDTRRRGVPVDLCVASTLGLGFFLVYLRTLCPTVYLGDSGEICAAIVTGGVIHPPGYPLFGLLGRIALALLPFGEPALRIGVVVALAAAAAVAALYLLCREAGAGPWASACAAAVFGAGYTFWSQAVRVEVYSLHILLVLLALLGALRFRRTGGLGAFCLAAAALSLGLAHHLTIVLVVPAVLLLAGVGVLKAPGLRARLGVGAAAASLGPACWLLLLVWGSGPGLQNWGAPATLPLLWNHVTARVYRGFLQAPDLPHLTRALPEAGGWAADAFPWLLWAPAVLGLVLLWRKHRPAAVGLLAVTVTVTLYNLCYRIDDLAPYFLPVWVVGAVGLAVALEAGRVRLGPLARPAVLTALFALLLFAPLTRNWRSCDLSRATWVRELARHKLESAGQGSVLLTQWDADTFPLWYVQDALGERPDVLCIDRVMLRGNWLIVDRDPSFWYVRRLRKQVDVPEVPLGPDQGDRVLLAMVEGPLRGRSLCLTFGGVSQPQSEDSAHFLRRIGTTHKPVPQGVVLRLVPNAELPPLGTLIRTNEELWSRMTLPEIGGARIDQELNASYVPQHYACMLVNFGGLHEMAGNLQRARQIYALAAEWAPGYGPARAALAAVGTGPGAL